MRNLHNRELAFVIQAEDVRENGGLRSGYVVHIGRLAPGKDYPVALACGAGPQPRFVYPFLPLVALGIPQPVCASCERNLRNVVIKGDDGQVWTSDTPSSNTGVN